MLKYSFLQNNTPTREMLIFFMLVLIYLIPVWAFQYFPSQDGPAHVYNSSLILAFNDSENDILHQFLEINSNPDPTWFGHLLLAGIMLFFPPLIAEKLLISIYIILFATGARYALGAVNPKSKFMSVLFFPFIYNYLLHMGFYAFSMSLALGLWVLGFWLKNYEYLTIKNIVVLCFMTVVLYLNHVVTLGMVCIVIANMIIGKLIFDVSEKGGSLKTRLKGLGRLIFLRISSTFLAFLPSFLLAMMFILSRETITAPGKNITARLFNLIHLMPVVSFNYREVWIVSLLLLFLAILAAYFMIYKLDNRQFEWYDFFLIAAAVNVGFYLLVPESELVSSNGMTGGAFMDWRVSYFIYFSLLLWLGAQHYSTGMKVAVQCFAVAISICLIVSYTFAYASINRYIQEYTSIADYIEPNTTLLPLDSCGGNWRVSYHNRIKPFIHVPNYIAAEKKVMSLRNYEANTGYFPFVFRPEKNPYVHIGTLECHWAPPPVNFIDYEKRTGGQIDYVSMWLGKKVHQQNENLLSSYRQLEVGFDLIYESPNGLVELYRRKNWIKKGD
jgi:hypothetical protein